MDHVITDSQITKIGKKRRGACASLLLAFDCSRAPFECRLGCFVEEIAFDLDYQSATPACGWRRRHAAAVRTDQFKSARELPKSNDRVKGGCFRPVGKSRNPRIYVVIAQNLSHPLSDPATRHHKQSRGLIISSSRNYITRQIW